MSVCFTDIMLGEWCPLDCASDALHTPPNPSMPVGSLVPGTLYGRSL